MAGMLIKFYKIVKIRLNKVKTYIIRRSFINECIVGNKFTCGLYSRCINKTGEKERIKIGNNCELLATLSVFGNGHINIGNYTTMRNNTRVISTCGIDIGEYVIISNNVTIYDNNTHPTDPKERVAMSESGFYSELWNPIRAESATIKIGDNVWVGERATILKGVTIGKGSIIGMNAMVTKDVPEYGVIVGNPGRLVKKIDQDNIYE